jgi:lipopolysaccharide export system permease protein
MNMAVDRDLLRKNRFGMPKEELTPAELAEAARLAEAAGRPRDARAYWVAHDKRLAAPLAAVIFALCAVPLALGRRGGARALGTVASLVAYVGYYVLSRAGEVMAEGGQLPPLLAAHSANLVFLVIGLLLIHRAARVEP